jgi:hypothetical protein
VEAHFELENLESQQHHYLNVVKSLSQDSLRLIKDILANPHPTTPYEVLKDRLLNNHSLTDFQKIERQFKIGELGPQQKPSELLAHLVELTPSDELESKYLIFLFIQRLLKILRMQLGDDLDLDLRDISERADRLWSIHAHDMASSDAAVELADGESGQAGEPVAAVAPFHKKKQQYQHTGRRDNGARATKRLIAARVMWQIRSAGAADLGPGHTVHLGPVPAAGHPAPADHRLPPPGEWYGRKVPPAAEGPAPGSPGGT